MTERTSSYHKLAYLGAIIVLAYPIVWLSRPARIAKESSQSIRGAKLTGGGKLAQLREQYNLAQVNLGEVDPASETIKLATLGLRGVAVNLLWEKANHSKMVEDWTELTATLEQLAKLQPNFITFWKFQAWNLTYNVSVEFDDYRDRYYYVRRGIQFLQEGESYNLDHPQLLWDLGWFIGQKIGRADEYVQYRRLFRDDDEFHPPDRSLDERDNWLVGKEWYKKAIEAVDKKGKSIGRKSPRDLYSSPAKSQFNYAEAIEEEGLFDKAQRAWQKAGQEWREFGNNQPIEHSTGVKMFLGQQKEVEKKLADLRARLDAMQPAARKKVGEEKRLALSAEERKLLDSPRDKIKGPDAEKRAKLDLQVAVSDREVAQRIAHDHPNSDLANQALQLASEIERQDTLLQYTIQYKHDANYDYWENRAAFEQTTDALEARELMFEARKVFRIADYQNARKLYEKGFAKWRMVIDKFPSILDEEQTLGSDILDYVKAYHRVLDQFEERLPENFPLWDVVEKFDRENQFTVDRAEHDKHKAGKGKSAAPPSAPAPTAEKPPAKKTPETPAKTPAPKKTSDSPTDSKKK
jgi:hypothetical protein